MLAAIGLDKDVGCDIVSDNHETNNCKGQVLEIAGKQGDDKTTE